MSPSDDNTEMGVSQPQMEMSMFLRRQIYFEYHADKWHVCLLMLKDTHFKPGGKSNSSSKAPQNPMAARCSDT